MRTAERDAYDTAWERYFSRLAAFRKRHGHCCPSRRVVSLNSLVMWIDQQRRKYNAGALDFKREQRLGELGFCWDPADEKWETQFAELIAFAKKHGHASPPKMIGRLGAWADRQRQVKAKGRLDPERERRLNAIGFVWNTKVSAWNTFFAELVAYKKKHRHVSPPDRYRPLGAWANRQRQLKAKRRMDPERERRLNQIGFVWNTKVKVWETHFNELLAYKKRHGHVSPPFCARTLGDWVSRQRMAKVRGKLAPERERRLNGIGFVWNAIVDAWETRFAELVAFKKRYGHANPPLSMRTLGIWMATQRRTKARGKLDPERERRLNKLGVLFVPLTDTWERRFAELVAFKKKHGHANPPQLAKTLGSWVSHQRAAKAKGSIDLERERRLNALGFAWKLDSHRRPIT